MHALRRLIASRRSQALTFRVVGHVGLAVLALTFPSIGPNRFLLAGLLVGFVSPVAILLNRKLDDTTRNWAEALFDLLVVVTVVHLVPHLWVAALALGLMVAIAPSIGLHPASHWIYLSFGVVLLGGMTAALVIHDVQGWQIPIAAVAVTYPSMLYYTYTQMRRANDLRQRAQLLRGLADLAGTIGHDFNNAMVGIVTNSELALAKVPAGGPVAEDLGRILEGTDRARRLCRQLLSLAGRGLSHRGRLEMTTEVQALSSLLETTLPSSTRFEVQSADALYVEAQVPEIHHVLMSIMLRAADAMQERSGPIQLRLERREDADGPAPCVQLTVRWKGPANPADPSVLSLLRASNEGGSWSVRQARRAMSDQGGSLAIEPDGDFTEAILSWPESATAREHATSLPAKTPTEPPRSSEQRNILVIDDDDGVRAVARQLFEKLGYGVITARNADHGLEAFERDHQRIEAVLLDLRMPGRDGWTCLAEIRNICDSTRVVVCSGYDPVATSPDRARNDPNLAFLHKPFLVEELTDAMGIDPPRLAPS